jgi:hypothetical protein
VVPQMIIRSPHVAPGKFAIGDAKRLLQQYLPIPEVPAQKGWSRYRPWKRAALVLV